MKKRIVITAILLALLLTNINMVLAKDLDISMEEARRHGEPLGYTDGYIEGLRYLSQDSKPPYYEIRPKESKVFSNYSNELVGKDDIYKKFFYLGYIEGFDSGYQEALGISTPDGKPIDTKTNYGDSLGKALGEIYGFRDFYNKVSFNWSKAIPRNSEIIKIFDLSKQTSSYRSSFLSSFRNSFKLSYEEGYEKANLEPKKITLESGISQGEPIGGILGKLYGVKDYFENRSNYYLRNLPSDNVIIRDYSLNKDSKEYKDGFLAGFKRAYEEAYNLAFREANLNVYIRDEENAYEHGKAAGLNKGEVMATKDYMEKKSNNWRRHIIFSSIITTQYNLEFQSNKYKQGFISGYNEGFAEGYSNTYKELIQDEVLKKSNITNIPIRGGSLTSLDGALTVNINKGTYYNNIALSIEKFPDNYYDIDSRFIKASGFYNIQVSNPSRHLNKDNLIELSFEYYGKVDGGVYKRVNDKWQYINSFIKDGRMIANIKPNTLDSGDNLYCILIDNNYKLFSDIRSHWAKDEINTLVRRNIIYGYSDNTFKPEKNITRSEFLTLLSRVYNWNTTEDIKYIEIFKDFQSFGNNAKNINYAISQGYIKGYEDNTFKPDSPISYKEVEIIMSRVLKDDNFRWYNTSAKMLYDKQVKSMSYNNMDNKITRAEVVYMLYILNEWRY